MRARGTNAAGVQGFLFEERNRWVNVTWMPHASLSQTSHVCLSVRSILAALDELTHFKPEEWQVGATIHGAAGMPLVPVSSLTPTSQVTSMKEQANVVGIPALDQKDDWIPLVSNATHICKIDALLNIPLRWRDLPRDAYIKFEVSGHCEEVVSEDCSSLSFSHSRRD